MFKNKLDKRSMFIPSVDIFTRNVKWIELTGNRCYGLQPLMTALNFPTHGWKILAFLESSTEEHSQLNWVMPACTVFERY